ncbi:hypothetical protein ACLGIH_20390 [Streptomyces sp. HMX87]|uniref:hypothetical protein n=1 Tax=Streptomyces sp. HMX87 TaxID=3390849 RepID=UPI003A8621C9
MPLIPLPHLEAGEKTWRARARWVTFEMTTPPGSAPERVQECRRSLAQPTYFAREETASGIVLRPNLLSAVWWARGFAANQNKVAPRMARREGVEA